MFSVVNLNQLFLREPSLFNVRFYYPFSFVVRAFEHKVHVSGVSTPIEPFLMKLSRRGCSMNRRWSLY